MTKKLSRLLESFLKDKRKSTGGYAEVTKGDMVLLERIVHNLIAAKFQRDPDGDLPVEYELIDRTTFERSTFFLIPYDHKASTPEEFQEIMDSCVANLSIAVGQFDTAWRLAKMRGNQKKP